MHKVNIRQEKNIYTGVCVLAKDPDPGDSKRPDPNPQHCRVQRSSLFAFTVCTHYYKLKCTYTLHQRLFNMFYAFTIDW